jgi:ribonuclease HII
MAQTFKVKSMTTKITLNYEERMAINTIRKSMRSKPEIIAQIMDGGSYAMAESVLLKARDELAQLLEVNRAFIAAASVLAKQQKDLTLKDSEQA